MKQLHERGCMDPVNPFPLTAEEKRKATESFVFMVEKTDGQMKSRTVANDSVQRPHTDEDQTTSPTTSVEAMLIAAAIDANENGDVATIDIPNAFIQTPVDAEEGERIAMKMQGKLTTVW